MQDYPKLLDNCDKVGYTSIDKGFCFTTLKNDLKTAINKFKDGLSPESAGSC
jgi:UDP-sugar pyrophosphorylase